MNMNFLPGSNNSTPELDEDDPARRELLQQILSIRQKTRSCARECLNENDNVGCLGYLRIRVRMMVYLGIMYRDNKISEKLFLELSQKQNGDILYNEIFLENRDARDPETRKTVSEIMGEYSNW